MIKFTSDKNDIIKVWQDAFGDSKEDVLFFINNVKNAKCLAYYDNDNIASMLYLIECNYGLYIYAASTLKDYKKRGYMTKLLDYCKNEFNEICLIPATENLIKFYQDRGFNESYPANNLKFNQIDDINEYLFEGCELEKPIILVYKKDE